MNSRRLSWVVPVLVLVLGPFVVISLYLIIAYWRPIHWFPDASFLIALVYAIIVGIAGLLRLPLPWWLKIAAVTVYVPIMMVGVALFSMVFVCGVFGDCL